MSASRLFYEVIKFWRLSQIFLKFCFKIFYNVLFNGYICRRQHIKVMLEDILQFFPNLSALQKSQYEKMMILYPEWNEKINVVSRKDIDNLEVNHILHSLSIAKFIKFSPETRILDFGTGGGFPGLPLAVMFPQCRFTLIDRTGKKIRVASEVASACGLENVDFMHGDVAEFKGKVEFVVSRAVMPQADLVKICRKNISDKEFNPLPNGLITLKGGDLSHESNVRGLDTEVVPIFNYFNLPFFETKSIVYTVIPPAGR